MWVSLLKLALIPYKKSEDVDGSVTTTEEAPPPGKIGKQPSPSLRAQLFCGNFPFLCIMELVLILPFYIV